MSEEVHRERDLLDSRPELRDHALRDGEFVQWRNSLDVVDVDGERLHVIHGDRLVDEDQLIVEWLGRFRPDLIGGRHGVPTAEDTDEER